MLTPWKESYDQPRQHIQKQRHYFVNKGPSSQGYGFSNGHVWMWELDCKESWAPKNWCFWTVVLEKTLGSPLDCKEIQPVHPKGNQSWIFIGRTDVEAETPILWPPEVKNWLTGKDPDAGEDWRREEKGMTEDEMVDGIIDSMDMSFSKLRELVMDREAWSAAVHGAAKSRTQVSDWTELTELAVQWLKLHASTAVGMGLIPRWGTKVPHATVGWLKKNEFKTELPAYITRNVIKCLYDCNQYQNDLSKNSFLFILKKNTPPPQKSCSTIQSVDEEPWI